MTTGSSTPTTSSPKTFAPSTISGASTTKLRAFVVTFAAAGPILYLISIAWNLPLITYHPAIGRIDLGWTPARSGEGPAMYWYGWTLTALVSGTIVSFLATLLPERVTRKIPLYLVWVLPILTVPLLAYSLRAFWLHP
jgi:hypothetical protein